MAESGLVRAVERLQDQIKLNKPSAFQYIFRVLCEKCLRKNAPDSTFAENNSRLRDSGLSSGVSNRHEYGQYDCVAAYFSFCVNVDSPITPQGGNSLHSHSRLRHSHVIVCLRFLSGPISIAIRYNPAAPADPPARPRDVRHPGRHRPSSRAVPPPRPPAPPCRPLGSG